MEQKHMGIAFIAAGMLSANAHANDAAIERIEVQPQAAFTEADMSALFEQGAKPMQLAALSPQEMRETKGAWVLNTLGWTAFGGVIGTGTYLYTTPRTQWSWGGAGRAFGSGATAGFYNSMIPLRAFGAAGSYAMGTIGAASWYRW